MFRTLWSRPFSRKVRFSRHRAAKPGAGLGFRPNIELLEGRLLLTTYWVLNTMDGPMYSLRWAILNANVTGGSIKFDIPSPLGHTINIGPTQLPAIMMSGVTIDGTTQPGSGGLPAIELNGAAAGPLADGLWIQASNTVVKGLVINNFANDGILVGSPSGAPVSNVVITDNYIGTDFTGTMPRPNRNGVVLAPVAPNNIIGRVVGGAKNVISGNLMDGIQLGPGSVTGNVVAGNYIGTDVTGTLPLGNGNDGVHLIRQANDNTIGGVGAGAKNVISGNFMDGVSLDGASVTRNLVANNYIGTDLTGTQALPNLQDGVHLLMGASSNTIEGVGAGAKSIISGNGLDGICLDGTNPPVTNNLIEGNFVGTDVTGTLPLGNSRDGVRLFARANNNTITANLLSANAEDGLDMAGINVDLSAANNLVQGNLICTDATGTTALGNSRNGISLHDGANRNTIGGVGGGLGNVISGNAQDGINLDDEGIAPVTVNQVQGNYIGTDVTGDSPLGNGSDGVNLAFTSAGGAFNNTIGGTPYGAGNVISGNGNDGVMISGNPNAGFGNLVQGNYIGTPVTGLDANGMPASFGNGNNGVEIVGGFGNLIGGTVPGAPNVIAHNGGFGVLVSGATAFGNSIRQNSILLNVTGVGITSSPPLPPAPTLLAPPAMYMPPPFNTMTVMGVNIPSGPAGFYTLEFFANLTSASDCEGWLFIGGLTVFVTPSVPFNVTFTVVSIPIPPGYDSLSATETDPAGSTSPFSACIPIVPPPAPSVSHPAGNNPQPAGGPILAWVPVSPGAQTAGLASTAAGPAVPQWSVAPASAGALSDWYFANARLQRDMTAFVFGSPDRTILPGDLEREALPARALSRPAWPLEVGWDLRSQVEPSLFDN